jgi:uncharacterized SAM-binding protein YcdF (DUF218 family)
VVSGLAAGGVLLGIHPFLAVTHRLDADFLVMEGWVHKFAVLATAQEFEAGRYQRIFTTGGPVTGDGGYTGDANTSASVGAGLLRKAGLPDAVVQRVPSRVNGRDRTYHAALALRCWLQEQALSVPALNVVTESTHARRTRLLFQKAFGDDVKIGVIAVPSPDYDARRWWRYSEGVREVLGETIAYLYARFLFHPDGSETSALNEASARPAWCPGSPVVPARAGSFSCPSACSAVRMSRILDVVRIGGAGVLASRATHHASRTCRAVALRRRIPISAFCFLLSVSCF